MHLNNITLRIILALLALSFVQIVDATQIPHAIDKEGNIMKIAFNKNETHEITAYYGCHLSINFEEGEIVEDFVMDDSSAWQINHVKNAMFIKPVEDDATTNVTIKTNRNRRYLMKFIAAGDGTSCEYAPREINFAYEGNNKSLDIQDNEYNTSSHDIDIANANYINFSYHISGPKEIAPLKIYDDGRFTFFEFRGGSAPIPVVLSIDPSGQEKNVEYSVRARPYYDDNGIKSERILYIVKEISPRMSLRYDKEVVCVFNEKLHQSDIVHRKQHKRGILDQ